MQQLHAAAAPFITVQELQQALAKKEPGLAVFDTDPANGPAGVPTHSKWTPLFYATSSPQQIEEQAGSVGLGSDQAVVVYDGGNHKRAAVRWHALTTHGHKSTYILLGGAQAWAQAGLPVAPASEPPKASSPFLPSYNPALVVTKEGIKARDGKAVLLDTRSAEEFEGLETMGNPRAGAIPGAVHWDYVDLLELVQGSKEAFLEGAKARGITPQSSIITYCQGGMRAAIAAAVFVRFGLKPPAVYVASMQEWSREADCPMTK